MSWERVRARETGIKNAPIARDIEIAQLERYTVFKRM